MSETATAKLAALTDRFRQRALAERDELSQLAALFDRGEAMPSDRDNVQRIAHRLAGAGGTFGFPRISACAAELDTLATNAPTGHRLAESCRAVVIEIDRLFGPAEADRETHSEQPTRS
jgi:HPt (histidine-containing phosphotransfer) domain-containing protein